MDVLSAEYPVKDVLIFNGSASGIASKSETAEDVLVDGDGWSFGITFAVGDLTGDGYPDLFVSECSYNSNMGKAHVFHATSSGMARQTYEDANYTYTGENTGDYYSRVASMVDVNGDGYADLITSGYIYSSNTGRVYIYHGSSDGASGTADTTLTGEATGHSFGISGLK